MNKRKTMILILGIIGVVLFYSIKEAQAVPSFKRQTGLSCFTCHTIYPELTPVGQQFKLGGYTMSKNNKLFEFPPPLAGFAQLSFTHVNSNLPPDYLEDEWSNRITSSGNDVLNIPQEASIFYGGKVIGKIGAFIQGTFDGIGNTFFLDMTDVRYANKTTINGNNLIYGITLNNSPTIQDVFNSTPVWGFPYETSDIAPSPAAGTIIDGSLDQQVGGIGLYAFWNDMLYLEATLYHTTKDSIFHPLGVGTKTEMVVDDFAPYWRIAIQKQWGEHGVSVGTYGIVTKIYPDGRNSGPSDRFTDIAFDAQYQYLAEKHKVTAQTTYIHEKQDWDASYDLGNTENKSNSLDTFKINLNYYYQSRLGHIGGAVAYFSTTGDSDTTLYSPEEIDGSRNGSPDSDGFIIEASYLPMENIKFTIQCILYNKFNGARTNYDGSGRDASDNNTLYFALSLLL
jgi:hypothetical protein